MTNPERFFVDEEKFRLTLRAEFAEFENKLFRAIDQRVATRASAEQMQQVIDATKDHDRRLDNVETWRNRLIGATGVCIFLSGFAFEIAFKHYLT